MADLVFDYSKRDEEYILAHLRQRAAELSDGQWTSFLDTEIAYVVVKTMVGITNFDQFLCDQNVAECFLSTCLTREAAVRKAKELGYIPDLAKPATCDIRVTCPAFGSAFTIPANTSWKIGDIDFTSLDEIVIPPGQTTFDLTLTQGSLYEPNPVTATGAKFYKILVPRNVANLVVTVDDDEWAMIDTFIRPGSKSSYKRYEEVLGQTLCFGADQSTYTPRAGQIIQVTGILTNGVAGNIESTDQLVKLVSVLRDSSNVDQTNAFTARMLTTAAGGMDVESTDSIKENAPKFRSAQDRAVTEDDYEALVRKMPGITSVKCTGGEKIGAYGEVLLVIYGTTPYSVTTDMKNMVLDLLDQRDMVTITKRITGPNVLEVKLRAKADVDNKSDLSLASAVSGVTTHTTQFISNLGVAKPLHSAVLSGYNKSKINGLNNVNFEIDLVSFATSQAGKIVIPLCKNFDLSAAELRKASDNSLLWSGNGTNKVTSSFFTHAISGLADQRINLLYKPSDENNVKINPDQIAWLVSLTVDARFEE